MWKRWLRYAKAKLDSTLKTTEAELDRREARLEAERAGKPWLGDDRATPSYDDVKERIDRTAPARGDTPTPSGNEGFDLAEQERAAAERLAEMRESLGLDDDKKS
jgi:hypothetical protein